MYKFDLIRRFEFCIDDYKQEGNSNKKELQDAKELTQHDTDRSFTEKLVILAKQGDAVAEEILVGNFKPLIFKELLRIKLKNFDYDDLEQIGYITVMLAIRKYVPNPAKGNFVAYVAKCIRNRFSELVRRNAKYNLEDSMDKPYEGSDTTMGETLSDVFCLEDSIIFNEDLTNLYKSIKKLPEKYRQVILECVLKDISMKDYAKANNMSYSMIVQRKHRAVIMLREMMTQD